MTTLRFQTGGRQTSLASLPGQNVSDRLLSELPINMSKADIPLFQPTVLPPPPPIPFGAQRENVPDLPLVGRAFSPGNTLVGFHAWPILQILKEKHSKPAKSGTKCARANFIFNVPVTL